MSGIETDATPPPSPGSTPTPEQRAARRARYFLYVVGGAIVAIGFALDMIPAIAQEVPPLSGRICAAIGVVFWSIGRFGSDRILIRCTREAERE